MSIRSSGRDNPDLDQIICYFMRTILRREEGGVVDLPLENTVAKEPYRLFLDKCMDIFLQANPPELARLLLDAEYDALLSQGPLTAEQTLNLRAIKELCWHIYYDEDPCTYLDRTGNLWGRQANQYAWRTYYPNLPEEVRKSLHVDEDALAMIPREMLRLDDY